MFFGQTFINVESNKVKWVVKFPRKLDLTSPSHHLKLGTGEHFHRFLKIPLFRPLVKEFIVFTVLALRLYLVRIFGPKNNKDMAALYFSRKVYPLPFEIQCYTHK